ncbi:hypothetical protein ACFBZI_09470 [Moraxella sp. ZJ142]|uniref:hypothetical protein n=1 Tax=Moraxella marmotae TaxID=3344520 RepID=UPI0035D4AFA7
MNHTLLQQSIERQMHPTHIRHDIQQSIQSSFQDELQQAITLIHTYIEKQEWESKMLRKQHLLTIELDSLVCDILTTITLHTQNRLPYVNVAGMIPIKGMSALDAIKTVCELIAVLLPLGMYNITSFKTTRYIESLIQLPDSLLDRIKLSCYLPPMITTPKPVNNNYTSGYLTLDDNVILGSKHNKHSEPLALDIINKQNQNTYELDSYIVQQFDKQWHRTELNLDEMSLLNDDEQLQYLSDKTTWEKYQEQFEVLKQHLADKSFHFLHKYDKRGRLYSQGYHFNPMGSSFEKACINFKHKQLVTGEL